HFDAVMSRAGLLGKVDIVIESNFPYLLFEYVRMGTGIALAPLPRNPAPSPHHAGVVLRDVSHLFGEEEICHVRRKGEFELPCAAEFREILTAHARPKTGTYPGPPGPSIPLINRIRRNGMS